MRLLIIVTTANEEYKLWGLTEGWSAEQPLGEVPVVKVASVADDGIAVLCQSPTALDQNEDEKKIRADIRQRTTPWVRDLVAAPRYGEGAEVYLAHHSYSVDAKAVREGLPEGRVVACAPFSHLPETPGGDPLYDALSELLRKTGPHTFEAALRALRKRLDATRVQRLTTLKHRIAHLFLPIGVDLQAWGRFNFDDEYMREMIETYRTDAGRLAAARELLYCPEAEQWSESDSVEKIVKEAGLERGSTWAGVESLLPRREPQTEAEKEEAPEYCRVFQQLNMLGSLGDAGKLCDLKTALRSGNPFGTWFSEFDAALTKLREAIEKSERAS